MEAAAAAATLQAHPRACPVSTRPLTCLLWIALALAGCDTAVDEAAPSAAPVGTPWPEMLAAVNAARAEGARCGDEVHPPVGPLSWNGRLEAAALQHTLDMEANDHFAHVGTDGSTPGDRAQRAGYPWHIVGENIARYQPTVEEVVEDWMASPGHCRQIMDPAFVEMGAAERDRYWTQVFGLPR